MAEQSSHTHPPATPDDWKRTGVRVIPGDQLDSNTAQTPGFMPSFNLKAFPNHLQA